MTFASPRVPSASRQQLWNKVEAEPCFPFSPLLLLKTNLSNMADDTFGRDEEAFEEEELDETVNAPRILSEYRSR
jgi:hypothetical protein